MERISLKDNTSLHSPYGMLNTAHLSQLGKLIHGCIKEADILAEKITYSICIM